MDITRWLSRARWVLVALLLLLLLVIVLFARWITDWLWFSALGYGVLFTRPILWRLGVGTAAGIVAAFFIWLNVRITRESIAQALFRYQERLPQAFTWRWIARILLLGALVLGFLYGASVSQYWDVIAKGIYGSSFGIEDPLFARDVGFYVFGLPLMDVIQSFSMGLFVLTSVLIGAIYFASGSFHLEGWHIRLSKRSRIHLSLLLASVALLKAWDYYLQAYELVFSPRGVVYGASYTDAAASLPALRILTVISLFVAAAILFNVIRPATRSIVLGIGTLIAASFIVGSVYPNLVQEFVVKPNELEKELPYIENHIVMTRRAYGLEDIEERDFVPGDTVEAGAFRENEATLQNIRLWDWRPLLATYNQIETLRLYYDFIEVDIDRYRVGGDLRQVMLSARELTSSELQNQSWVNMHLQYTHGYGLVMSPVNEVSPRGLPRFFINNIPPETIPAFAEDLRVERPEIYYGEQDSDYVVVKTRRAEFDYPMGDENATAFYEGTGGVQLGGLLRRSLFAARVGTTKLLLSTDITADSRIMLNRRIDARVRTLAPFLRYDGDPYLVLSDGRLYWIQDAYTTSNRFPYATPVQGWGNYVRNSVKVVIDAYNGSVDFYVADPEPVVSALSRIYPGVFKPISEMPAGLKSHIRYPEDYFRLQSVVLTRYHMTNAQVFYNQEDVWEMPREVTGETQEPMQPYYVIMKLPGEQEEEFVLMLPFTPVGKGNMIAWLAARSDGDNYGKLLLYQFSKQEVTFGPMQFEARIDQDTEISSQLTLWSQQGSNVIRGNLLIFPVGDALMYVEPLYLQAEQSRMPEFKRVIVGLGGDLVMRATFEEALQDLLGVPPPDVRPDVTALEPEVPEGQAAPPAPAPGDEAGTAQSPAELVRRAGELFDEAQERAGRGDWQAYGDALDQLGRVLEQLQQVYRQP